MILIGGLGYSAEEWFPWHFLLLMNEFNIKKVLKSIKNVILNMAFQSRYAIIIMIKG
jgi:hypothetical protein